MERSHVRALTVLSLLVLVLALGGTGRLAQAAPPTSWPGGRWTPDPATYGDVAVDNVTVTMSDGVNLVGDIEYPSDAASGVRARGAFPVLLTMNPYACQAPVNQASPLNPTHEFFVQRGYIFATICVRGTGRSGGEFTFLGKGQEARDGVELVDWAAHRLDGSNGVVGLTGCSYLGLNQLYTAELLPANSPVKEISPFCAGAETYREGSMGQGMATQTMNLYLAGYALWGPKGGLWSDQFWANYLSGGADAYAGPFWQINTAGDDAARIVQNGIPALLWSGWGDIFAESSNDMYAYLQNAYAGRPVHAAMHPGDSVTGRYQLVEGPWGHGAGIDQNIQLEWFDTWLKGQDTGMADTKTPMHLWDLGTKQWINTSTFPMTSQYTPYYLESNGGMSPSAPAVAGSEQVTWEEPGPPGSSISYTTQPLAVGATLAGPVGARLYASSTNRSLELIAGLSDVAPDGTATSLSSGWVIGSLRARDPQRSWSDGAGLPVRPYCVCLADDFLVPGTLQPFDFWISPRIATIDPGHSLRLTITTQTPKAICNSGALGDDPCTPNVVHAQTLPGTYTVVHSAAAPSLINLPLLPRGVFKPTGGGPIPLDWGPPASSPGSQPPSGGSATTGGGSAAAGVAVGSTGSAPALPFSAGPARRRWIEPAIVVLLFPMTLLAALTVAGRRRRR